MRGTIGNALRVRFAHIQRKDYFKFRNTGSSADAPVFHFHRWGTPSVIACGDATFPKGTASAVTGNFTALPKGVPLGELANVVSLRG